MTRNYRPVGEPIIVDLSHVLSCAAFTVARRDAYRARVSLDNVWIACVWVVYNTVLFQLAGLKPFPIPALVETAPHFLYSESWVSSHA